MLLEECWELLERRGKKILWGMTPQRAIQSPSIIATSEDLKRERKRQESLVGAWFYIDVWNCQAQLALYEQDKDGRGQVYPIEENLFTPEELE